jgi:hypothetical protein
MHNTPIGMSSRDVASAMNNPNTAATPNAMNAAVFTLFAGTNPEPTSLSGPTLLASVPLMPSE